MPAVKLLDRRIGHERLDRYELVGELASGGMATVFLGRILGVGGFQRFVAIKRLHPHLAGDQEFVEMFLDEARLAASIHHPNVVPILEVGTSDRGYYLVMEYIEGDTLARLLARATTRRERIPVPIVVRVVLDTLAGLHAAHELRDDRDQSLNLVHRDVSPQNILVGINGTARITDFGVARAATRLSSTRSGQLKGKLAYMAPEQARGGHIDRRADVFSTGAVLWEALADRRLFKGESEAETLNRVLFEPIPSLRQVAPHLPPALELITMKSLYREPERRHETAAEFADELERAARASQSIASVREVAEYVLKIMGHEIAEQREAVRRWLAESELSRTDFPDRGLSPLPPASPSSSVSSAAITIPPHSGAGVDVAPPELAEITAATRRPKGRLWGGLALLALLGAGYFVWAGRREASRRASIAAGHGTEDTVVAAPSAEPARPWGDAPPSEDAALVIALPSSAAARALSPAQPGEPVRRPAQKPPVPGLRRPPPPSVDDIPSNPYR